eukprot:TRINITY_DN12310_c0_g1_i1.p1 TRINITY_DN12310_c0_g1~~TRINITY_DN12310_c0_g1_i1.p1  ORF type:complete len:101 (-),score=15.36 TRINITY_DN12310_c0_g1_i1:67-369(-)
MQGEAVSSLKAYMYSIYDDTGNHTGKIKYYAGWDGTLTKVDTERNGQGKQLRLDNGAGCQLIYFHVVPKDGISVGMKVKTGDVGFMSLPTNHNHSHLTTG